MSYPEFNHIAELVIVGIERHQRVSDTSWCLPASRRLAQALCRYLDLFGRAEAMSPVRLQMLQAISVDDCWQLSVAIQRAMRATSQRLDEPWRLGSAAARCRVRLFGRCRLDRIRPTVPSTDSFFTVDGEGLYSFREGIEVLSRAISLWNKRSRATPQAKRDSANAPHIAICSRWPDLRLRKSIAYCELTGGDSIDDDLFDIRDLPNLPDLLRLGGNALRTRRNRPPLRRWHPSDFTAAAREMQACLRAMAGIESD